jgi:hypothetical protein
LFTRNPILKLKCLFMIVGLPVVMFLSGCAYPNELRKENQVNPGEFITVVQQAVDQFHAKTDVLPIKNSEMSTPIYEKYVIDFSKLQKNHYLTNIPMNAFESGGVFLYVLVNVETKPEVKLIDLTAYQSAVDVQKKVEEYQSKHSGEFPYGEKISPGFYYVDFKKLGMKEPVVKSAYNRQNFVNYLIHEGSGQVAIDYGQDLMKLVQAKSLQSSLKPAQDLRELLVASSYFVPAKSLAYHWSGGQPIPVNE